MQKTLIFLNTILAVIIHEAVHLIAANNRGYQFRNITLMPYGGTIACCEKIQKDDETFISLIGPISNILIAFILIAFWWLVPESYYFTNNFVVSNMTIGLFNLIPAYPLDMSRVILSITKNKTKALKILRLLGVILGCFSLIFFIISIFYTINITFFIIGIVFTVSATFGIKKEYEMNCINRLGIVKNTQLPIEKKTVIVDSNIPIVRLTRLLSPNVIYTFEIVENGNIIKTISEERLVDIAATAPRGDSIAKWI